MLNPNASNSETTTAISFQPMGFTGILDTTFSFYRDHFRLLIGISAFYAFWHLFHRSVFSSSDHWLIDWFALGMEALFYGWLVCASMQIYLGRHTTLGATFRQIKRRFWSYLGSSLIWLLVSLTAIVIGGLFGALATAFSPYNYNTIIDIFTMPILSIEITLLYFDQRIRKEGFDIEMMVSKEAM